MDHISLTLFFSVNAVSDLVHRAGEFWGLCLGADTHCELTSSVLCSLWAHGELCGSQVSGWDLPTEPQGPVNYSLSPSQTLWTLRCSPVLTSGLADAQATRMMGSSLLRVFKMGMRGCQLRAEVPAAPLPIRSTAILPLRYQKGRGDAPDPEASGSEGVLHRPNQRTQQKDGQKYSHPKA